jgi:signal transduction histidine kinase
LFALSLRLMLGPTEDALASHGRALVGPELETVYRNELRLLKLVNTLLDFARTEAGRMRATYVATDLATHTAELASMFRSAIERAGLHFRIECAPLCERIYVDPQMWEKIVLNLLSNALKFTFHGEIAVRIEDRGDTIELSVTDTGVGIPAHELPHLFERFHRVEGGEARTHEGSGIGLALVHDLVGEHGGTIEATSTPGFGSRFVVTLRKGSSHLDHERIVSHAPVRARATTGKAFVEEAMRWLPDADAEPSAASAAPPGAARVLVADDNADMREYVTRLLRTRWIVHAVADGRAALEAAIADPPDLVLADVMMPKLDGFELVAELRRDPLTRAIPVVLLSARAGEEARIEGLQAGADDYLFKPFSARELITRVETHLELSKARHDAAKDRERLLRREQDARLEAEAASRAKDEFLGVISHELRTPLNAVMGWSRLLLDGGLSPVRHRHGLEVIERNARTQAQLIDDLLDVSRIISGKVRIDPRPIRPAEFVSAAVESVRLAANAKAIDLQVDVDSGSDHILGDCDRLQQVVWNLLSNAIKFTPSDGRVTVRVTRNAGSVEISVSDNGRGIRADFLPHVFERFRQADSAMTRSVGGLGLGLAIARHLTELHGGTIDASSNGEGLGSTFTVRLPMMARHVPAVAHEARERGGALPRTIHDQLDLASFDVLVVDDEQDARDVLTEILERANARVIGAASASEAYELLARERPAVLVSDIGMPGEDGFTLIRRVRALPAEHGGRTPAIALTAYARPVDRQQALLAGYDVHLGKPIDPGELIGVVAKLAADARD